MGIHEKFSTIKLANDSLRDLDSFLIDLNIFMRALFAIYQLMMKNKLFTY